jgi:hypothetical protein
VLAAYQKLISMFWHFDKSGVFEMLDNNSFDLSRVTPQASAETTAFASLRRQLDDIDVASQSVNDIQALDIIVTRLWMRVILWRLAASHGFFSQGAATHSTNCDNPFNIARELLGAVTRADRSVIEAHGPALVQRLLVDRSCP